MGDPREKLLSPTRLNGLELRNRVIRAATFEGMCPGGRPSERLVELHRRVAEGGVAMTTIAYCGVEPDGRIREDMMYMHEGIRPDLERLAREVHEAGARVSGQLVHCGAFTQNRRLRGRGPLGPSRAFNRSGLASGLLFTRAMSHADIDRIVACFHDAAAFMRSVGFDAIEIHFGHGYGLSQFISPKTNRRTDEYGGSLANRMRYPLRALEAVRRAVGDDFPLLAKIGLTDGVPGGLEIDEAVEAAAMLDEAGIDAVVPSGGTSSMNPMLLFRGGSLLPELLAQEKSALMRLALKLGGRRLFRDYPYEELYFLDGARRVRDRVKRAEVCYIGGASTLESLERAMREFELVQMGRALIKDPAFVEHARADPGYVNGCDHCNRCAARIWHPGGICCVTNEEGPPPALA